MGHPVKCVGRIVSFWVNRQGTYRETVSKTQKEPQNYMAFKSSSVRRAGPWLFRFSERFRY